jgi:hypothetical protein
MATYQSAVWMRSRDEMGGGMPSFAPLGLGEYSRYQGLKPPAIDLCRVAAKEEVRVALRRQRAGDGLQRRDDFLAARRLEWGVFLARRPFPPLGAGPSFAGERGLSAWPVIS